MEERPAGFGKIAAIAGTSALLAVLLVHWRSELSRHVVVLLAVEYLALLPAILYALRARGSQGALPRIPVIPLMVAYLAVALSASWIENQGQIIPDENGYSFQARIIGSGKLAAAPLPGAPGAGEEVPKPLYFEHHVFTKDRWFTIYPVGWPALLAAAQRLHVGWIANPLVGLVLLLLTAACARRLYFPDVSSVAVLMAVVSPYFLVNCIGLMPHPLCGALLAGACLFCFDGLRTNRVRPFVWMFLLIAAAFLVRPFTAWVVGGTLGLGSLWYLRRERIRVPLIGLGLACVALCAASFLGLTRATTGGWRSPYLFFHSTSGAQVDLNPHDLLFNLLHQTRWGVQETVFFTFPFAFLLAGYAVWREKEKQRETRILGAVMLLLIVAHLVQQGVSVEFIGERYYFEGLFAVAILAARGAQILAVRRGVPSRSAAAILVLLTGFALLQTAVSAPVFLTRIDPYRKVREAADRLPASRYAVFLQGDDDPFVAKHFNLNRPDWDQGNLLFLVDPGPADRDRWACRAGRPKWVVIGYDQESSRATELFGDTHSCESAQR